jgi:hypothetical protein
MKKIINVPMPVQYKYNSYSMIYVIKLLWELYIWTVIIIQMGNYQDQNLKV